MASVLSGPLLTTNASSDYYSIICRLPLVLLGVWMDLLAFNISNQRQPGSVIEDAANKPWRALPSGRISEEGARRLLLALIPTCIAKSLLLGGTLETMVLFILTWLVSSPPRKSKSHAHSHPDTHQTVQRPPCRRLPLPPPQRPQRPRHLRALRRRRRLRLLIPPLHPPPPLHNRVPHPRRPAHPALLRLAPPPRLHRLRHHLPARPARRGRRRGEGPAHAAAGGGRGCDARELRGWCGFCQWRVLCVLGRWRGWVGRGDGCGRGGCGEDGGVEGGGAGCGDVEDVVRVDGGVVLFAGVEEAGGGDVRRGRGEVDCGWERWLGRFVG